MIGALLSYFGYRPLTTLLALHWSLNTMNKPVTASDLATPKVTTGPMPARARSTQARGRAGPARAAPRDRAVGGRRASRTCRSMTPPASTPTTTP